MRHVSQSPETIPRRTDLDVLRLECAVIRADCRAMVDRARATRARLKVEMEALHTLLADIRAQRQARS